MKKPLLIFCTLLLSFQVAFAQSTLSETEKLASTARIWGFLKYYHPHVAKGKFNWDEELFTLLPSVKASKTKEELSQVYLTWVESLGQIGACKRCNSDQNVEYFDKNFDLSWIDNDQVFTADLSLKLRYIEQNRHQGKKYYVTAGKRAKNIIITNENEYKDFDWSNENLRLLSLFRYWNYVEYFSPYKYQTEMDWDGVLHKMIPKFLHPKTERDFYKASMELVVSLNDGHASFYNVKTINFIGSYIIPAEFMIIDDKAVFTNFYNDSLARVDNLQIGDAISKIDGRAVKAIFDEQEKYITGSNLAKKKASWRSTIFNGASDAVEIEYVRNNETSTKTIRRYLLADFKIDPKKDEKFKTLGGNIGYVNTGLIDRKDVEIIMEEFKNTDAIIFDIRTYPSASFYQTLSKYINSTGNSFYKSTYPDLNYPGKFIWKEGTKSFSSKQLQYKGKVVLLTNEKAISHAEFTIMCLQAGDNVTTIGSQTSGADGNVSDFKMVDGYRTGISGIGIFYPDGTETQRKGVKIDIEANPTIEGIAAGKDEILEKAIDFINLNL
ncbi:S41 family peptidase [Algoriphagus resistens]|uniref:S41 family peptidase n=1 Tax=Algoriphagus resistens TaxID=1750590 RepID=UPI000716954C|nr:S41 family peptidase [Algoriphagus resistens]